MKYLTNKQKELLKLDAALMIESLFNESLEIVNSRDIHQINSHLVARNSELIAAYKELKELKEYIKEITPILKENNTNRDNLNNYKLINQNR